MARRKSPLKALSELFDRSDSPVYLVDHSRTILYCNVALSNWTGIRSDDLVGRLVEYHSEHEPGKATGVAAGLCPPPGAFSGVASSGHVSCQIKSGALVYRSSRFEPLRISPTEKEKKSKKTEQPELSHGVLCILAAEDQTSEEIAAWVSPKSNADILHAAIRTFRRQQAKLHSVASLIGCSPAMQTIQKQVTLAIGSTVPVAIVGPSGSGREHLAGVIHYGTLATTADQKFAVVEAEQVTAEEIGWTLDSLRENRRADHPATLLVKNVEQASREVQLALSNALEAAKKTWRLVVTMDKPPQQAAAEDTLESKFATQLQALVLNIPPLSTRLVDLPLLAQLFLEECNQGSAKQLEGFQPQVLETLATYTWPGELDELRSVIQSVHVAATGPLIEFEDLPNLIYHAAAAASLTERKIENIDLEKNLEEIERNAILKALEIAKGNKTQAAELLGMNRPRFYRRLEQLGLDDV